MVLRACIAWLFTAAYWPVALTVHLLALGRTPESWRTAAVHFWGRTVLRILSIKLELLNESTISDRRARVVIINHQSALDLVWAAAILPPAFLAIGKKELIHVPVVNLVWWALGLIRIDRRNHVKALEALKGVAQEIALNRRSLMIAPEGTRTRDGRIARFKKGAFRIAADAGVPIYPVVVSGAYDLLPRSRFVPKKGVIRLYFLPPLSMSGAEASGGRISEELIEKVRSEMIECERRISHARIKCA